MLNTVNYTPYNNKFLKENTQNLKTVENPSNLKSLNPLNKDTISFCAKRNILKEYGIKPDEVEVVSKSSVDKPTKILLLKKLLQAHEHAAKNKELGNFTGRYFATNMMFENGEWSLSANIENTIENVFCGERSAVVRTWNQSLEKLSLKKLRTDKTYKEKAGQGLKAKYLAMSAGDGLYSYNACSDCLDWLNEDRYFSPKTLIATLEKSPESGKFILKIRNIKEILPYWGENAHSITDKPIEHLKIEKTEKAGKFIAENKISDETLRNLVQEAKTASEKVKTAELSGKNAAVSALFSNGKIAPGERMDWTRRWSISPDLIGITKYLQDKETPKDTKVLAIAYYGNNQSPHIDSLGRVSQDRGSGNTLVLNVHNDKIEVKTIYDYIPYLYISSKRADNTTKSCSIC